AHVTTSTTSPSPVQSTSAPSAPNARQYVTQDQLTAQLGQIDNALRSLFYQQQSAPGSQLASGGIFNNIAVSQSIHNLSNVSLSDVTVSGVSGLTAADIPNLSGSYLPLSGGTMSGVLTAPSLLLTSTTSTSTISGSIQAGDDSQNTAFNF